MTYDVTMLDMVNASFEYQQIDILDCCLEYHLILFKQDICETSLDLVSSIYTTSGFGRDEVPDLGSLSTSSKISSEMSSSLSISMTQDTGRLESRVDVMDLLDKILEVATLQGKRTDGKMYAYCLYRLISHLIHLMELCNSRDSRMLSFQVTSIQCSSVKISQVCCLPENNQY